jgi:hypothetical protein
MDRKKTRKQKRVGRRPRVFDGRKVYSCITLTKKRCLLKLNNLIFLLNKDKNNTY